MSVFNPTNGVFVPSLCIPVVTGGDDTIAIQMKDDKGVNASGVFALLIIGDAVNEDLALATVTKGSVLDIAAQAAAINYTSIVLTDASGAYASAAGNTMGFHVINLGLIVTSTTA